MHFPSLFPVALIPDDPPPSNTSAAAAAALKRLQRLFRTTPLEQRETLSALSGAALPGDGDSLVSAVVRRWFAPREQGEGQSACFSAWMVSCRALVCVRACVLARLCVCVVCV